MITAPIGGDEATMIVFFTPCSGYLLREEMKEQGWCSFVEVETELRVLLIHQDDNGTVPKMQEALDASPWPDLVVCCNPHIAAHIYPDLVFVDDPDYKGEVDVYFFPDMLVVLGVALGGK
jgi:hypothetical protein